MGPREIRRFGAASQFGNPPPKENALLTRGKAPDAVFDAGVQGDVRDADGNAHVQLHPSRSDSAAALVTARQTRRFAIVGFVLVLVALLAWHYWPQVQALTSRAITAVREAGPWAFFGGMALLPLVGVPTSPFTFAAGPVFGPTLGSGLVIVGALAAVTVNAVLAYWIAAKLMRPVVTRIVEWLGYRLPEVQENSAWMLILVVRFLPFAPFFAQSYLLGLARVPFLPYLLISVGVQALYIVSIVLLGDALARHDRNAMIIAGVLLLLVGTTLHFLRRKLAARARR